MIQNEKWMKLHDSEITHILLDTKANPSTLILKIKDASGVFLEWTFREIIFLKMTDVGTQNIVFDVNNVVEPKDAKVLLKENFDYLSLEQIEKASKKIEKKEWLCFEIRPSIGADIKIVFASQKLE